MQQKFKLLTTVAALCAVVVLYGCQKKQTAAEETVVRPVKVFEFGGETTRSYREYPGAVAAIQNADLGFEVAGRIIELPVDEGQQVKAGQKLARLDPRDYESGADAARARVNAARAEYERSSKLYETGAASARDLDSARRNLEVTEADLRTDSKALEDAILVAPFDGFVARKLVDEFTNVKAKEPVLVLQDTTSLKVVINIPERDWARVDPTLEADEIKQHTSVEVMMTALPDRWFPAQISEVATVADPVTRTYAVTLVFDPPSDRTVLPGMTAKVRASYLAPGESELTIPAVAVAANEQGTGYVWVVDDDMRVNKRPVQVGKMSGSDIEIIDGLNSGERIAISGVHLLREGETIRPIEL
ncbi:MAG: efflux RND transporter periplasmic adaptor subunit [Gammaproteobacteria bacterium]